MEYGILIAEHDGEGIENCGVPAFQVVSAVDSIEEAKDHIDNYIRFGSDNDLLAPDRFVIVRRDSNGYYTRREVIE